MKQAIKIVLVLVSLAVMLAFISGCNVGGATIKLQGMSLGTVTMDGKPIQGLPSDKIDLLLQVAANQVTVKYGADKTTLTLSPSGATVEINASGIVINGLKPEQVKVEWASTGPD